MSASTSSHGIGPPRSKREPVDVLEPKPQDKSLDKILGVRKQRLDRYEREKRESRESWRETRVQLRQAKEQWKIALEDAKQFWQDARADFFSMTTTSGQFRQAKAIYERMKGHAAQLHLESKEAVIPCKEARHQFFEARRRALEANKQQEKLGILRDEIHRLNRQEES